VTNNALPALRGFSSIIGRPHVPSARPRWQPPIRHRSKPLCDTRLVLWLRIFQNHPHILLACSGLESVVPAGGCREPWIWPLSSSGSPTSVGRRMMSRLTSRQLGGKSWDRASAEGLNTVRLFSLCARQMRCTESRYPNSFGPIFSYVRTLTAPAKNPLILSGKNPSQGLREQGDVSASRSLLCSPLPCISSLGPKRSKFASSPTSPARCTLANRSFTPSSNAFSFPAPPHRSR